MLSPTCLYLRGLAGWLDSGVTQVQLRAPANANPLISEFQAIFSLTVGSTVVRDMNLSFWVD